MPVCTSPSYSQFSSLSLHDALPISLRLALKIFRREPAISVFDWLFTPTHTSSPHFSSYVGSGLQSVLPDLHPGYGSITRFRVYDRILNSPCSDSLSLRLRESLT